MKTNLKIQLFILFFVVSNSFAQTKLNYKVLNGTSFNNVTQTIIYGEKDAVLIDGGLFNSDAHRAVAAILDLKVNLTMIYITHPDADHYFGLDVLTKAFPEAKVVALPQVADEIMKVKDATLIEWKKLFKDYYTNFPKDISALTIGKIGTPEVATIDLEGNELKVVGLQRGDKELSSFIWVPSLKMIVAGDIIYNATYPWTSGTTPEERGRWIKSVDNIIAYKPTILVPGHTNPSSPYTIEAANFTKSYLKFYDEELAKHLAKDAFLASIKKKYPIKVSDLALQIAVAGDYPATEK
ncbi:MBL fold metallo-hydrolase [soil metagenome]